MCVGVSVEHDVFPVLELFYQVSKNVWAIGGQKRGKRVCGKIVLERSIAWK